MTATKELKVYQINVGISLPSQDLAIASANRLGAHVICITEPHVVKSRISPTPGWKSISSARAAILYNFAVQLHSAEVIGNFAVKAKLGNVEIVSIYLSPNEPVTGPLDRLYDIVGTTKDVIVAGDLNIRLKWLTSNTIRPRDKEVENFILGSGLGVWNDSTPTCIHQGRESINNYTLSRSTQLVNWKVHPDIVTQASTFPVSFVHLTGMKNYQSLIHHHSLLTRHQRANFNFSLTYA